MGMPKHLLRTQLHCAKDYALGKVKEEPLGSNRGFWVEEFQEDAGINPGDAWCAAGVYSCHEEACDMQRISVPFLKRTGWCKGQWLYALKQPRLGILSAKDIIEDKKQIPDGAIWIRYADDGTGHTGFVFDHDPDKNELKSIEFNCGNQADVRVYIISNIPDFKGVII